jgi:hypothetical protein
MAPPSTTTTERAVTVAAMHSGARLLMAPALVLALSACEVPSIPPGVGGLDGVLAFEAPTDLVFSTNIAVGSTFELTARPLKADTLTLSAAVDVGVNVDNVASVAVVQADTSAISFLVTLVGPGAVRVAVTDGGVVLDRFDLNAVPLGNTSLVDASLLPFADAIDVTVPATFALVGGAKTTFGVAAVDRCGQGVLDFGASTLVVVPEDDVEPETVAAVVSTGLGGFEVTADAEGASYDLVLQSPGLTDLSYVTSTVDNRDIDEVRMEVAAADGDTGSVTTWARAFASGDEVLGLKDHTWSADARITLNGATGPVVTSTFGPSVSETGQPDSPGTITVSVVGEEDTIDLVTFNGALVAGRGAGPERAVDEAAQDDAASGSGVGCVGSDTPVCDPLAALVPILGLRRLSRRRRQ